MCESLYRRLSIEGAWREDEELAWRLWAATARRAVLAVKHKRDIAAEIYWRSAFDIALAHLKPTGAGVFSPLHLLEPLQGLVNQLLEQGRWRAARSLFNEVVDFLANKGFTLTDLAQRVLIAIANRVALAQKENLPAEPVEGISLAYAGGRLRCVDRVAIRRSAGSVG